MTVYRRQSLIPAGTFLVNDAVHVIEDDEQQAVTDTLTTTDHKHLLHIEQYQECYTKYDKN